jgi:hypothetical protein
MPAKSQSAQSGRIVIAVIPADDTTFTAIDRLYRCKIANALTEILTSSAFQTVNRQPGGMQPNFRMADNPDITQRRAVYLYRSLEFVQIALQRQHRLDRVTFLHYRLCVN